MDLALVPVAACLTTTSAGVTGEGKLSDTTLTAAIESLFSWELRGSAASLLGSGVMFARRLEVAIELDFVVSLRQGEESAAAASSLGEAEGLVEGDADADADAEALGVEEAAALEKNPKMLFCCLPVDGTLALLAVDEDGVRAGAPMIN